ncbi:MAG: cell division protein SepF [Candidatus Sericytochromatia bacterium]|nr:cell division protein SepF [Candidatus Tanganyikabacteria bacterium]
MSADVMQRMKDFFLGPQAMGDYEEEHEEPAETTKRGRNISVLHGAPLAETLVLEPRSFDDALSIISHLREKRQVILNLHTVPADERQRLVDFLSGATLALDGYQERVSETIFAFSPSNHKISRPTEQWGIVAGGHRDLAYKVK